MGLGGDSSAEAVGIPGGCSSLSRPQDCKCDSDRKDHKCNSDSLLMTFHCLSLKLRKNEVGVGDAETRQVDVLAAGEA